LADRGDVDELRALADDGDGQAAARIVELLAELGDLKGVRNEVIAGNPSAGPRLITLLAAGSPGQRAEATRLRRWGLRPDGSGVRNDAEYE
jgi:hypothetical protein